MKKDVLIKIRGVQRVDGENDSVELLTTGLFYKNRGNYYISYDESQSTGFGGARTVLKVEKEERVTMSRSGSSRSQLIIEKGRRHQCHYETGFGAMTIGISSGRIVSRLNDSGGDLEFFYSMDINSSLASENEVYVNVKECAKTDV
jgi:uncharacterized beta-barrel protein YwiB (DUF1934 family)